MHSTFHGGFFEDLPPALRIIDQQQRGILAAMAVSDAPVHVTHALAGCGKSTVLQCLVALYAKRHARVLDSEAGSHVLVCVLRVRTLRHELLQALLQNQALQPRQVTGGRLPLAGALDDDAAYFEKVGLAMPEPSRHLPVDEEARAAVVALRENIVQTHAAHNTWAQQDEALALKRAATGALGKLWSFHQARPLAAAAALRRVAVLRVTGDVALKIFGRCATPGSPAARLMRETVHSPTPG